MTNAQSMPNVQKTMNQRPRLGHWSLVIGHWSLLTLLANLVCSSSLPAAPAKPASADPTLQTEDSWIDDRWRKTEIGQFLCAWIGTPRQRTVKGIAIEHGDPAEGAVCFDADLMRYSAGLRGGFLGL